MNKNLFIYSFKYLAVLLALVTFSSCERDEFTEQDAFDLQQAQLDAETAREEAALAAQDKRVMDMAMFRRSMDSLTRLNSGGKVFYTVNVVPGGSSAFSSGRFEEVEGLDGATVTVSQLGGSVVEQKTTVGGLASFEMYSGEVTVNVEAANHTDLNYTANLTPDGGVPNGALMYVGNVVPVFDDPNNPAAGSEENLATVKGFAFAELDITGGNNFEESVPDGTKVRAFIDVANPAFKAKYIDQANDEGVNNGGQPTASGAIQRFAYEEAASTTGSTVTSALNNDTAPDGGEYSITIGATASGLPITMKFDDFAADRTYLFGDPFGFAFFTGSDDNDTGFGPGQKRFIYTQNTELVGGVANQAPTALPFQGAVDLAQLSNVIFDFATTEATATATITGGDAVRTVAISTTENWLYTGNGTSANVTGEIADTYLGDANRGSYLTTPTVVFSAPTAAGGVTATGVAIMSERGEGEATVDTDGVAGGTTNDLRSVIGVKVTNPGSGYAAAPTVTFVRNSFTGKTADVPNANGIGTIVNTQSGIGYVEIIDGGFGYTDVGGAVTFSGAGNSTGVNPAALFNNSADPVGQVPTGGTAAAATVVVDRTIGTVTQVDIPAGSSGSGYTDPIVTIANGSSLSLGDNNENAPQVDGGNTIVLFETNGAGGLRFANGLTTFADNDADLTNGLEDPGTGLRLQQTAIDYALVPNVVTNGTVATINFDGAGAPAAGFELPEVRARVNNLGQITELFISNPGSGFGNVDAVAISGITVSIEPIGVRATANAFVSSGGGIGNYVINNYGTPSSIYSTTLGTNFNYVSATNNGGVQEFRDKANAVVAAADVAANSDYIVAFAAPAAGGTAATGYPVFEQDGSNLVGVYVSSAGSGYAAGETPNFWVIPAGLSLDEYKYGTVVSSANTNNASATATLVDTRLTLTFTDGGLGYAIRPEFVISGGNKSAEDLAGINSAINGTIRGELDFNGAGSITNTSVEYTGALPFTAADLAAEPIAVTISSDRLAAKLTTEANGTGNFNGFILVSAAANGIDYAADVEYDINGLDASAKDFFNAVESGEFTNDERVGSNGVTNANLKYITAPTFTVDFLGLNTGGAGVATLDVEADITALTNTTVGSLPSGLVFSSFIYGGNDTSYNPAGERFRTIGGSSSFEVFSGLTYIRDVNYGTGIELE